MKIGTMEAVREKFIDMYLNTWIIHTSVGFTNHILDTGSTPSVITAIMKQPTTERARKVLNHGMDIYAGGGICTGANNFFTPFYHSSPVGITVEGSNTLTRGLIIFGQGLNKSHPHIFPIFESIQESNLLSFQTNFNRLVASVVVNYCAVLSRKCTISSSPQERLDLATLQLYWPILSHSSVVESNPNKCCRETWRTSCRICIWRIVCCGITNITKKKAKRAHCCVMSVFSTC
jgi:hypothetical protein